MSNCFITLLFYDNNNVQLKTKIVLKIILWYLQISMVFMLKVDKKKHVLTEFEINQIKYNVQIIVRVNAKKN